MERILEQVGSYSLLNYLLPGVLYAFTGEAISHWAFTHENIIATLFFSCFYGIVISRIGAFIEWLIGLTGLLKRNYPIYLKALKNDGELSTLSEIRNTYRSLAALVICLLATKFLYFLCCNCDLLDRWIGYLIGFLLLPLFVISFIVQNNRIATRATETSKQHKEDI